MCASLACMRIVTYLKIKSICSEFSEVSKALRRTDKFCQDTENLIYRIHYDCLKRNKGRVGKYGERLFKENHVDFIDWSEMERTIMRNKYMGDTRDLQEDMMCRL